LGVVVPLGRLAAHQLRELAHVAQVYGSGTLRLTPWQNILIPDVPDYHVPALQQAIAELELPAAVTHPWSALVAYAGSTGCEAVNRMKQVVTTKLVIASHREEGETGPLRHAGRLLGRR